MIAATTVSPPPATPDTPAKPARVKGAAGSSPGKALGTSRRRSAGSGKSGGGEVDEVLAARLRVAVTRLSRRLRQESLTGVSPSQEAVLGTINRLGRPTLGELAQAEQVQPPTMTRVVAAMEAAGWVTRHGDAGDRRVARVELTREGRATLERIRTLKTAFLTRQLAQLAPGERDNAAALAGLLERLVEDA